MFKKRQAGGPVGLDLDCSFLAAAAVSDGRIARAASTELPPGIVSDGEVADPSALSAALKEFFARAGLPKAVRLGVSNQQIVVRQLELPPIEDEREQAAEIAASACSISASPFETSVGRNDVTPSLPSSSASRSTSSGVSGSVLRSRPR